MAVQTDKKYWQGSARLNIDVGCLRSRYDILMDRNRDKFNSIMIDHTTKVNYIVGTVYLFLVKKTEEGRETVKLYLKTFCDRFITDPVDPSTKSYNTLDAHAQTFVHINNRRYNSSWGKQIIMEAHENEKGTQYMCFPLNEFNRLDVNIYVRLELGLCYTEHNFSLK